MTLPTDPSLILGGGTSPYFNVQRSLRFRASASAYLSRTPGSAPTSSQKGTISLWFKGVGQSGQYLCGKSAGTIFYLYFNSSNQLVWQDNATNIYITNQVFRDPSAWYHLVVNWDTTQATAANRQAIYVNGAQVTSFATTNNYTLNTTVYWFNNDGNSRGIGSYVTGGYFDGYIAEFNAIDGQQLDPTYFGYTDPYTGVWMPKKYSGTSFGTNGFYLTFQDNSNNTATTIGKDWSGNGNNWTPTNISVSSGVTYDSMLDVPTNWGDGGNGRGNYCVLNPVNVSGGGSTITNGNLACSAASSATYGKILGSFGISSGKWYWEATVTAVGTNANIGLGDGTPPTASGALGYYAGELGYLSNGNKYTNAVSSAYGAAYTTNDVIGVAYDADAGSITFYKNNVSQGAITGLSGVKYAALSNGGGTSTYAVNFGQRPFAYTPPSGYKALCTQNLPTPTILNGAKYMAATTWTGNGTSLTINNGTNTTSNTTFQPDFIWMKNRGSAYNNILFDTLRGFNALYSDLTNAENTPGGTLTAYLENGFSVGNNPTVNENLKGIVGWQWNAGSGSSAIPSGGTITPTGASINTIAGFSIIAFTRTASATDYVPHGLGVTPSMIFIKARSTTSDWNVWHQSMDAAPNNYYMILNTTAAKNAATAWCVPSSTTVGVTNFANGVTAVMYCWTAIKGFSAFGSYTGNGSTDGPFIYTGFLPRFVMYKRTDSTSSWFIQDTTRQLYNVQGPELYPDSSSAEGTATRLDFLSNGFKIRAAAATNPNVSGATYIYAAFAENPFNVSRSR